MKKYIVLLRGVNVGGKSKMSMSELKKCLEELGYAGVQTYIASGNVILKSQKKPSEIREEIEKALPNRFELKNDSILVLVLTPLDIKNVVDSKPKGFGESPTKYHSDVIFMIDATVLSGLKAFSPKEGVDTIWPGKKVIYSQRLSSKRTQSRLNRVMSHPLYKNMTVRNWNTVTKLYSLVK
jgi:uncharacterized protein (DUF1697 family)